MSEESIRTDFDAISALENSGWNHNNHYFGYLLSRIPGGNVLEIGCGAGEFCALMAKKCGHVTGVDLSDGMIERARDGSSAKNLNFLCGDIFGCTFEDGSFDCIVSVATLHHLPYTEILTLMKRWLKPGGVLLILDLYQNKTTSDFLFSLTAVPINLLMKLIKNGRVRQSPEEKKLWAEHSQHDHFMTLREIRGSARELLPGAYVKRLLFWRYVLSWRKPMLTEGNK